MTVTTAPELSPEPVSSNSITETVKVVVVRTKVTALVAAIVVAVWVVAAEMAVVA